VVLVYVGVNKEAVVKDFEVEYIEENQKVRIAILCNL